MIAILKNKYSSFLRLISSKKRRSDYLDSLVGPYGYWDQLQQYQFNFLLAQGLKKHHTLLDMGCGPLQGGLAFIDYLDPGSYTGIDMCHEPLTEAYRLIAEKKLVHKNPILINSNTFGRKELIDKKFDYIWISQLFYHLDDQHIHKLFQQLTNYMKPNSIILGDIIGYPNNVKDDSHWRHFRFHVHSVEFLEKTAVQYDLLLAPIGTIKDFGYPEEINLHTNQMLKITKAQ